MDLFPKLTGIYQTVVEYASSVFTYTYHISFIFKEENTNYISLYLLH